MSWPNASDDPSWNAGQVFQAAVPRYDGALTLPGLRAPVTILRDQLGVPHLRAGNLHDLFFAQGFVQAQDRLWQMEYDRRRATGRWAELAGPDGVEQDLLMRRLGLTASARADIDVLNDETRAMLQAFSSGVNAFVDSTDRLPIEFTLLGISPEPWEPWHCAAVFKVRHALMGTAGYKLWRLRLLKTLGPEWIDRLRTGSAAESPLIVPPGVRYADLPDGLAESGVLADLLLGLGDLDAGSNNWAIHGSRTSSGKPLLAGDPHRAIDVPNVYYQIHLVCPEFNAVGFSFAGLPGLPHFGHNDRVAWGVTHAYADYQDLYIERFAPGDPTRYEFRGDWRQAERRRETIEVRGAAAVQVELTTTHHGPIVIGDPDSGLALALRYTATIEPNLTFEALLPMLRATTVDDLDQATRPWVDPGNNFVMADVSGTIGYLTRGQIPIRPLANGWLPVPGWTGEYEWQGSVPFEDLPRSRDPEQGFIVTANQRSVGPGYPYYVSFDWVPPHRAQRINERLAWQASARASEAPMIHADKLSIPARVFLELAAELEPLDAGSFEAKARLLTWDGALRLADPAAAIYEVWRERLTALILEAPTFAPLVESARKWELQPSHATPLTQRFRNPVYGLLLAGDVALLPRGESWATLGARALSSAVEWLTERLGPQQDFWFWERIHTTRPRHPLSASFPELAFALDPPAVGVGGDGDTPQNGGFSGANDDYTVTSTAVARYCFDLGDWERSGWSVPLGASGHAASPHYADQLEAWSGQRLHPMLFDWQRVEAAAENRQVLIPGDDPARVSR